MTTRTAIRGLILVALFHIGVPNSTAASGDPRAPFDSDLAVSQAFSHDSVRRFSFRVANLGPETARGVVLKTSTPAGAGFTAVEVSSVPGEEVRCSTPPYGGEGSISCEIGDLPAGISAYMEVRLAPPPTPGIELAMTLTAVSDTADPDESNNVLTLRYAVPPDPVYPVVSSVRSRDRSGEGFSIEILGEHLSRGNARFIGIGCDCEEWPLVRAVSSTQVILLGGKELRALFPKGVPIRICIFNAEGGVSWASYTR